MESVAAATALALEAAMNAVDAGLIVVAVIMTSLWIAYLSRPRGGQRTRSGRGSLTARKVLTGRVYRVVDGGNFGLETPAACYDIRLVPLAVPGLDRPWGVPAQQALADKILWQQVTVEVTGGSRCLWGRVRLGARDINLEMVAEGHAWARGRDRRGSAIKQLQRDARRQRRGLWQENCPVSPRAWRKGKRSG